MHDSEHEPAIDSRCPSDADLEDQILNDIANKSGNTKQILWLYFVMGHKTEDIHKILGGSYENVRKACTRFRASCQEKYGHLMKE